MDETEEIARVRRLAAEKGVKTHKPDRAIVITMGQEPTAREFREFMLALDGDSGSFRTVRTISRDVLVRIAGGCSKPVSIAESIHEEDDDSGCVLYEAPEGYTGTVTTVLAFFLDKKTAS